MAESKNYEALGKLDPDALLKRCIRWLLRARRNVLWHTGISVMLLCFAPVFSFYSLKAFSV
ncbi:MAG: hypothetical protein ABR955_03445 [Verrucomicrobiota bacterium]